MDLYLSLINHLKDVKNQVFTFKHHLSQVDSTFWLVFVVLSKFRKLELNLKHYDIEQNGTTKKQCRISLIFVGSDFYDFKILISPKPLKKSTK